MGALLAAGVIVALALSGRTPGQESLARFEPAGIVQKLPARATAIEFRAGERAFMLTRSASNQWQDAKRPGVLPNGDLNRRVATALHFLEVTAPARVLDEAQYGAGALAQFGLAPERYRVTLFIEGKAACTIEFGGLNPSGTGQYVRVLGREKLYLMPPYFGRQWEEVALLAAAAAGQPPVAATTGRDGAAVSGASPSTGASLAQPR
jgi:hypothetical protein